jgi:hypothetical protein
MLDEVDLAHSPGPEQPQDSVPDERHPDPRGHDEEFAAAVDVPRPFQAIRCTPHQVLSSKHAYVANQEMLSSNLSRGPLVIVFETSHNWTDQRATACHPVAA